jgi:hypothetical protein
LSVVVAWTVPARPLRASPKAGAQGRQGMRV